MTMNIEPIRNELNYLLNVKEYAFGIMMDNGNMNYLSNLEIDKYGDLMCYLSHIDDYYYVAKGVTVQQDESSNWMDHLYYRDEFKQFKMFRNYLVDKGVSTNE